MQRFLTRLALLSVLVGAFQVTVIPKLRQSDEAADVLDRLSRDPDVIYFCDSTNRWVDDADQDKRSICQMAQESFPDLTFAAVDKNAFHAGVYESVCELLADRKQRPKVLVVPINLRSFSPAWDRRPSYEFNELQNHIRYAETQWRLGLLAVRGMFPTPENSLSDAEYFNLPVYCGGQQVGQVRDFDNPSYLEADPQKTKDKFIFHYMYSLTPRHRKLQSFANLARTATQSGSRVVFYITPLDIDSGSSHLGRAMQQQVAENVRVVRDQLDPLAEVIDLSFELPSDAFTWHQYPNEHLNQHGRQYVATAITSSVAHALQIDAESNYQPQLRYAYRPGQLPRLSREQSTIIR